jgi:hypothetical protein
MRLTGFPGFTRGPGLVALLAAMIIGPASASADMVLSLVPANPTVSAGSTNNVLELQLVNTGGNTPDSSNIAATSFDILSSNPDIVFTLATTGTTAPYIFPNSAFGPTISTSTGQEIIGSDIDGTNGQPGVTVGTSPVGVAEIFYNVLGTASPGSFTVSYGSSGGTSLTDTNGDNYTSLTLNTATINIVASSVPEPGTLGMGIVAIIAGVLVRRRTARTTAAVAD